MVMTILFFSVVIVISLISTQEIKNSISQNGEIEYQSEGKFVLKDYNGRLALFEFGGAEPIEVYDVYTSSLPGEESARMASGILARDEEELLRILEDYIS